MNNTQELHDGAKIGDSPTVSRPRRTRQKHGLTGMIRGRSKADAGQLDGRSAAMQAMSQYRRDLVASLGGIEHLSQQEITLIEICSRDWLILESIDSFLLSAGLFHRKKRTAYPLTIQRMAIADSLTRRLQSLGLQRRAKPVSSLADLLKGPESPQEGTSLPSGTT